VLAKTGDRGTADAHQCVSKRDDGQRAGVPAPPPPGASWAQRIGSQPEFHRLAGAGLGSRPVPGQEPALRGVSCHPRMRFAHQALLAPASPGPPAGLSPATAR